MVDLGLQDRTVFVQPGRLLRVRLLLLRRRQHPGGARPRPGGGHRGQARHARQHRHLLPGRRRSGGHRHGRDHPRGQPRREHHRDLRQQRDLRHDRRPDGADHAHRPEDDHLAATAASARQRGLPDPRVRADRHAAGAHLHRAHGAHRREEHQQDASGDPQGAEQPGREQGLHASSRCSRPARPAGRSSRSTRSAGPSGDDGEGLPARLHEGSHPSQVAASEAKARPFVTENRSTRLLDIGRPGLEDDPDRGDARSIPNYANPRLKIAGFGGQGILLLGVTALAATARGYHRSPGCRRTDRRCAAAPRTARSACRTGASVTPIVERPECDGRHEPAVARRLRRRGRRRGAADRGHLDRAGRSGERQRAHGPAAGDPESPTRSVRRRSRTW